MALNLARTRFIQLDGDREEGGLRSVVLHDQRRIDVRAAGDAALPAAEAVALARDANDEAASAVRAHPARFRAFATLPTSDPQAAAAELERCATQLGHVGAMVHGRTGTLDFTSAERVMFSTDYPFHQPDAKATGQFFDAIPDPADRARIASGNAEALFHLT
jgi:predicted TIM-barrel fold metal-dependent hydrolase